jgi:hypothetical protein
MNAFDGIRSAMNHIDCISGTLQATREEIGDAFFVFNDQNTHNAADMSIAEAGCRASYFFARQGTGSSRSLHGTAPRRS